VGDGSTCGRDLFSFSVRPDVEVVWWAGAGGDGTLRTGLLVFPSSSTRNAGQGRERKGKGKEKETHNHPHYPNVSSSS
jgi:hypothetical protein